MVNWLSVTLQRHFNEERLVFPTKGTSPWLVHRLKMDHGPDCKIKLLEENKGDNIYGLGFSKNFLKVQSIKIWINWASWKFNDSCILKETIEKRKIQATDLEKYL